MRIRKIVALALAVLVAVLLGVAKCEEEGTHPSAPQVNPHRAPDPTAKPHNPLPKDEAVPVPKADPFLIDRAPTDPHLALLKLNWDGAHRHFAIEVTLKAGGRGHTYNATGGEWQLVLGVSSGMTVGFTAFPNGGNKGTAICAIYHLRGKVIGGNETHVGDYHIVQTGPCAVSYKIP